jgi:alkylhydroperoxidase/carboxymuconolactone decarboxylase family protein YurZ
MPAPLAELSSVATALDELNRRLVAIADKAATDHDDETASELFAVERALRGALRRLDRLTSPRGRRR